MSGVESCGQSVDEHLQANMGHGVTGFGLLCFSLLTLALFGVCGCLCGFGVASLAFLGICFFNMPRLETLLGLFIWNVVMRLFQDALYKQNKTRLIQGLLTLQYVFIQKK